MTHERDGMAGTGAELSGAGQVRRAQIKARIDRSMRWRNARRRASRVSVAAAVALIGAGAAWIAWPRTGGPGRVLETPREVHALPAIRLVDTDPSIVARLSAPSIELSVRFLGDDELQDLLAAMQHPTGLIRTRGQVLLVSDIIEEPAAEPEPEGVSG